jgi:hypothetical protein
MQKAKRAIGRLALVGWLGLFGAAMLATPAQAATPPERVLPDSTLFLFKINDAKGFREAFRASHYGQLWNDPALKDFRDDISQKLEDVTKPLKEKVGVNVRELLELPQGAVSVAVLSRDDPKLPIAVAILADAGDSKDKMADVLNKATKQAEDAGAKSSHETFNGLTIHILREAPDDKDKEKKDQQKGADDNPDVSLAWTESDGVFYFGVGVPGADLDVVKDLTAHREGRDNALTSNESFNKTQVKIESGKANLVWFLDVAKVIKLAIKASAKGNEGQIQQSEVLLQTLGVEGLKSIGGSFHFSSGHFDSLTKTFFLAPKPVQGLLKVFSFPPARLRPEPWVPATAATYQSMSWDFDQVYDAVEAVINQFQPGMINLVEQQLVGPNGGAPLSFKKDLFGPLGSRLTLISDFKKPVKEDSQRYLMAVALDNAKAFQDTVSRLFEIAQTTPKKREFQGTTIYDVELPNVPNPNAPGAQLTAKGTLSFAIAKNSFFVTTDTALLEQVLRPGNAALEENAGFQSVAKEIPDRISGMTFFRPDESIHVLYDLIKSGQYEKAFQQALGPQARGPRAQQIPPISKVIPHEKLPEFSAIAKYLTLSGSYSLMDDDGFMMTGFTLKRPGGP